VPGALDPAVLLALQAQLIANGGAVPLAAADGSSGGGGAAGHASGWPAGAVAGGAADEGGLGQLAALCVPPLVVPPMGPIVEQPSVDEGQAEAERQEEQQQVEHQTEQLTEQQQQQQQQQQEERQQQQQQQQEVRLSDKGDSDMAEAAGANDDAAT
jgi:hypothetical protein